MNTALPNRYLAQALQGARFDDVLIIDSHVHVGPWALMHVGCPEWKHILRGMDRIGIDISLMNGILTPDYKEGNNEVSKLMKKYPGRITGIAAINPMYTQDLTQELTRCFDDLGFKGIKIHELVMKQSFSFTYHPDLLEPIFEFARARDCPILFHGLVTESMIRSHPKVAFICAHGPMNINFSLNLVDCENYYVDTCYTVTLKGTIEYLINRMGAHRILFGTDVPLSYQSTRLAQVLCEKISDDDLQQILGLNAARLYKIPVPHDSTPHCISTDVGDARRGDGACPEGKRGRHKRKGRNQSLYN